MNQFQLYLNTTMKRIHNLDHNIVIKTFFNKKNAFKFLKIEFEINDLL